MLTPGPDFGRVNEDAVPGEIGSACARVVPEGWESGLEELHGVFGGGRFSPPGGLRWCAIADVHLRRTSSPIKM